MFGKSTRAWTIGVILTLFCVYIIRLYIEGKITLYIHPRYALFALAMSCIGAALLVAGLLVRPRHHAHVVVGKRVSIIDVIVVIVLLCALTLPAKTLSWAATEKKALATSTNTIAAPPTRQCIDFKPETVDGWVYALSEYPVHCYEGAKLSITGFVYIDGTNPLPDSFYHIGKMVMSCCVVDARPFALPVEKLEASYPPGTWLSINGHLKRATINGTERLVIHPDSIKEIPNPDKPYEYLNTQVPSAAQQLQPLSP